MILAKTHIANRYVVLQNKGECHKIKMIETYVVINIVIKIHYSLLQKLSFIYCIALYFFHVLHCFYYCMDYLIFYLLE